MKALCAEPPESTRVCVCSALQATLPYYEYNCTYYYYVVVTVYHQVPRMKAADVLPCYVSTTTA